MSTIKRIKTGDIVKVISGSNKGVTGKVVKVLPKEDSALVEGVGNKVRHIRPTMLNPKGGKKDIHVPVKLSKLVLVIDEKTSKTSRVGYLQSVDGRRVRVARQANNREIK
ncbi:50S ribosomal protein L24 [Candidatus Saccharibacteria bacterium]|nr:50S ribosomal protein L24 [Candidatus Saccharibacteria bacterium]